MTASKPPAEGTPITDAARKAVEDAWKMGGMQAFTDEEWLEQLAELERDLQTERQRCEAMKKRNQRDGNWLDNMGACRVCDGEIPDGHTDNCDVWKLEQKIEQAESRAASDAKDARRYRWLREPQDHVAVSVESENEDGFTGTHYSLVREELDAAIDAASGEAG